MDTDNSLDGSPSTRPIFPRFTRTPLIRKCIESHFGISLQRRWRRRQYIPIMQQACAGSYRLQAGIVSALAVAG